MSDKIFAVFGASGFGREVMPLMRLQSGGDEQKNIYFVDDAPPSALLNGHQVITYREYLELNAKEKYICVAIADSGIRENLTNRCVGDNLNIAQIIAPNALILDEVDISIGSIICPFVTITSNVKIGKSFHANIYSYVGHDCVVGDYVTFAPGVKCNGNVLIEDYSYIGTGAIIKQGRPGKPIIIGERAVVGMGSVVTKNVAPGTVVFGNPAKLLTVKGLRG
jgi:sugar O-acyltransferase (sialic acid O-acetyltransferase NeuD family)